MQILGSGLSICDSSFYKRPLLKLVVVGAFENRNIVGLTPICIRPRSLAWREIIENCKLQA